MASTRRGSAAMALTRRGFALGSAIGFAGGLAGRLARPAMAQSEPIRLGWLAALTGPSSAPGVGFDRGVVFAANEINAAGMGARSRSSRATRKAIRPRR